MSDQREPALPGGAPDLVEQRADGLRADCANCFALCCVAPAFAASADFAIDKPAGRACPNLRSDDFGCGVHTRLRDIGFSGCTVYDCFGAGQKVAQVTYAGQDWRRAPHTAKQMFRVFPIMRDLHELLRYLHEAQCLAAARPVHDQLRVAYLDTERLTLGEPAELLRIDVGALRHQLNPLLLRASELVRAGVPGKKKDRRGADLIGARLKGADLRGANLRGAYLIGADLRTADLRFADVIGADFRDADLRGADLTDALYLVQSQLDAAKGDLRTTLPAAFTRPGHWGT
ncbi:pentapeptide repeat-containing protein [Embleya sp. NPDC020886]|uniref:pentapeptide repeat-containing protein n=1 Tax=Embleya sp. NPDC020886 TaxID=3363980 RepID=UPI0037B2907F